MQQMSPIRLPTTRLYTVSQKSIGPTNEPCTSNNFNPSSRLIPVPVIFSQNISPLSEYAIERMIIEIIGIGQLLGHSGPLCYALSLSSSSSWTSMRRRRATVAAVATPGE